METGYTLFFRGLAQLDFPDTGSLSAFTNTRQPVPGPIKDALYAPDAIHSSYEKQLWDWLHLYHRRISEERLPRDVITKNMNRQNPWFVLRNYLAQMAIDKAHAHDFSMIHDLLDVMKNPYKNQPGKELFAAKRPEWARHRPGCSMLSCSS